MMSLSMTNPTLTHLLAPHPQTQNVFSEEKIRLVTYFLKYETCSLTLSQTMID